MANTKIATSDVTSGSGLFHLSELRIVLLGTRTCGKSSAGNTILNREEFELTQTDQCLKRQGDVAGRRVTVVDTPGWRWNDPVEKTPELVRQEIVRSVSLCPPGPHTLLLVITLVLPFTDKDQRSVEGHLELLGKSAWSHTIVLFTYGDCLGDTTIEQHIESEGKALQWLVEKCGNRYHVFNNENRASATQVTELLEKIEEVVAGNNEGHYEIDQTDVSQTHQQHPQPEFVKNPISKSIVKEEKTDGGQRKKLTKEMISNPTNFKHVDHIGWGPTLNS
ncbi:GTPase IMAP family member 2 isoform X2 [Esox lucius]|uniref:GTPase IMAP family member 2 isoform X2 n=1 Tax=Esox lucius TaxID=8010 RepID=UPI001476D29C|nr:GTPase IMAP family member 2 isoform X2 [Esox lucius]